MALFQSKKKKETDCDTHSGWSIIFVVSKSYLLYRRTENSEHSKQLGTKKRAGQQLYKVIEKKESRLHENKSS